MSYRSNVNQTKDSLFATGGGKGSGIQRASSANNSNNCNSKTATTTTAVTAKQISLRPSMSPAEKSKKMKEAQLLRDKAKKALSSGLFSSADPISASTYYKQAAEIYKSVKEDKLEFLIRQALAETYVYCGNNGLAAVEYVSAATLALVLEDVKEAYNLHVKASGCFLDANDLNRSAEALFKGAQVFLKPQCSIYECDTRLGFENQALIAFEKAVSTYVPDKFNRYNQFKSTSVDDSSIFIQSPYAGENLMKIAVILITLQEIKPALFAVGASSYSYENDSVSTVSLNQAYFAETILLLALGDVVAAEKAFLEVHVQKTSYLNSRECEMADNLIRSIKNYDQEALDAVKVNHWMGHMDRAIRQLAVGLRIVGGAKKISTSTATADLDDAHDELAQLNFDDEDEFDLT